MQFLEDAVQTVSAKTIFLKRVVLKLQENCIDCHHNGS